MPRFPRLVVPDCAHHVTQRGVRRGPSFHDDSDYLVYLRVLGNACRESAVAVWAYALMTNHVHMIMVPDSEIGISRALQTAHTEYALYFNGKYGLVGHIWQGRPYVCVMDEAHTWNAVRYVERNPVRANMVLHAEDYLWSSAAAHCGIRQDTLLCPDFPPGGVIDDWSEWLKLPQSEEEIRSLRRQTRTGRPWSTPEFVAELEKRTGRSLVPHKKGRPKSPHPEQAPLAFQLKKGDRYV